MVYFGRYKTDIDFLTSRQGLKVYIELFYKYKREKELDISLADWEVLLCWNKRLSIIHTSGNDTMKIFGSKTLEVF